MSLQLTDITLTYPDGDARLTALDRVSLDVPKGSLTADYLNGTTFTITKILSATQYEVGVSTEAQQGTGGGATVAPTYVRPDAGTYVFTPDANSQVKGTIKISSQDLANSIYSTLGVAQVYGPGGTPYEFTTLVDNVGTATTDLNTGYNTQWGAFS